MPPIDAGPRLAILRGADAALAALLTDVLADLGIGLHREDDDGAAPDLALAVLRRGQGATEQIVRARGRFAVPVLALLPFLDEPLESELRREGLAWFTLGAPLDELKALVLATAVTGAAAREQADE